MKNDFLIKGLLLLSCGLLIMAFGVAFSIKAALGTSPISSLPFVISLVTPLTVGTATIVMHCAMIVLQILVLRKDYRPIQLGQLLIALVFGYMTDFALWAIDSFQPHSYLMSWLFCALGILLVGIGVSFEVNAKLIPLAGEGLILAICQKYHRPFPSTKICFDCTLVLLAVFLSLSSLHTIQGVREGTAAAALFVGFVSKLVTRLFFTKKSGEGGKINGNR